MRNNSFFGNTFASSKMQMVLMTVWVSATTATSCLHPPTTDRVESASTTSLETAAKQDDVKQQSASQPEDIEQRMPSKNDEVAPDSSDNETPPALKDALVSPTGADKPSVSFVEFTKDFQKGRISPAAEGGPAVLEILNSSAWIPLMEMPDLSTQQGCDALVPTADPGIVFEGATPAALVLGKDEAVLYTGNPNNECVHRQVLLQNAVPSDDKLSPLLKIEFDYRESIEVAQNLRADVEGDFLPEQGVERLVITLDEVWIENSKKKKLFSYSTTIHGDYYDCAFVSAKLLNAVGDDKYIQIREGRPDCIMADSGQESFETRIFRRAADGEIRPVSLIEEKSDYSGKASGSSDEKNWSEEWKVRLKGGELVRREMKFRRREDWSTTASEYDVEEGETVPKCGDEEMLLQRVSLKESSHGVDWYLMLNKKRSVTLTSIDIEPSEHEEERHIYCGTD